MFKRNVKSLGDVLNVLLREEGLETPLLQKRLIDSWEDVMGPAIAKYTLNKFISNQTLVVHLSSPALRADLSMRRKQIVMLLNQAVGRIVIVDVRFN
jgi:predicted nucleic acid-binding Zn ribbon protein